MGTRPTMRLARATDQARTYAEVRALSERLAEPLSPEDQTAQTMPDVSPTKWHLAHTTWFFETFVLERHEPGFRPHDPAFRVLFNSYYQGVGDQYPRAERGAITRPGVAEVLGYRRAVDERIAAIVDELDGDACDLVELGLHHEQQHQELLLMDIKHVLSRNPTRPVYAPQCDPIDAGPDPARWVAIDGGLVDVGHGGDGFAYDNECPQHRVHLDPYELADRLVTSGEWIEFIDDGGYERPDLWLSDGWYAVQQHGWVAPLYWQHIDGEWNVHTLGGTRPVAPAEPVCHVSHYEADAFARWAGARLPTEFEWEHAVSTAGSQDRWFALDGLHPVAAPRPTDRGVVRQAAGECWQWTASAYLPYPGFVPAAGAVGEYNGKFMSGQMVLRGSSALTPPGHTRPTYRNFFPPAARWPMTGVRMARNDDR